MKITLLFFSLGLSMTAFSQNLVLNEFFSSGTGANFRVNALERLLPGDKILIVGNFDNYNGHPAPGIARIENDGSFDEDFSVDLPTNNFNDFVVDPDGGIVAVGEFTGLRRFNADGSPDINFLAPFLTSGGIGPSAIAKQGNKYLVTGDFSVTLPGGETYKNMLRLNADGSVDATFAQIEFWNTFDYGKILVQEDGYLLIAGKFNYYNDIEVNNLMRLLPDGVLDASFSAGTGPLGMVREAIHLPDGKYLLSGDFETYNGEPAHLMVKLNNDGTKDDEFAYLPNVGLPEDGIIASK